MKGDETGGLHLDTSDLGSHRINEGRDVLGSLDHVIDHLEAVAVGLGGIARRHLEGIDGSGELGDSILHLIDHVARLHERLELLPDDHGGREHLRCGLESGLDLEHEGHGSGASEGGDQQRERDGKQTALHYRTLCFRTYAI